MRRVGIIVLSAALVFALPGCRGNSKDPYSHKHVTGAVSYPDTPPKGGPHSGYWLACGVYTAAVPNENAVHSLEHGAVWLTYQPGLPAAQVQQLAELAAVKPGYLLVSPYPGQPALVMATAWGQQISASTASDPAIRQFVQQYAGGGQGGEKGADCAHGVTPEDGRRLLTDPSFRPTAPAM